MANQDLDRRGFLRAAGRYAGAAAIAPSLPGLLAWRKDDFVPRTAEGYGSLRLAGPELALPDGFGYVKFGVQGSPMTDGTPTPRAHDGMGAFGMPHGTVRFIQNHEDPRAQPRRRRASHDHP